MKMEEARRKLKQHDLEIRVDWLRDHIGRLGNEPRMRAVVPAWRRELLEKRQLLSELKIGLPVSERSIKARVDAAALLRGAATRRDLLGR